MRNATLSHLTLDTKTNKPSLELGIRVRTDHNGHRKKAASSLTFSHSLIVSFLLFLSHLRFRLPLLIFHFSFSFLFVITTVSCPPRRPRRHPHLARSPFSYPFSRHNLHTQLPIVARLPPKLAVHCKSYGLSLNSSTNHRGRDRHYPLRYASRTGQGTFSSSATRYVTWMDEANRCRLCTVSAPFTALAQTLHPFPCRVHLAVTSLEVYRGHWIPSLSVKSEDRSSPLILFILPTSRITRPHIVHHCC